MKRSFSILASVFGLLLLALALPNAPVAHAATTTVYDWVWEQPTAQGDDLTGVHCLSDSFCKTTVITGDILSFDGTRWNADVSGTTTRLNSIFCATTTLCKAVGNGGVIRTWDGNIWNAESSGTTNTLTGIACPSTTLCKAVGYSGTLLTWNGTAWSAETSGTTQQLNGVACPLTTYCKAVGNDGTVLSWNGAVWSSDTSNTTENVTGVTCLSDVFCKAVGFNSHILSWNGTVWSVVSVTGGWWFGISCSSTTYCRAVGHVHRLWTGGSWGFLPVSCALCPPRFYSGISCITTATYCKLVGRNGTIVTANGAALSTQSRGSEVEEGAISCASMTVCKAMPAYWHPFVRSWNGTTWSDENTGGDITANDYACPTTTLCKAVGYYAGNINHPYRIYSWNGSSWAQEFGGTGHKLNAVACPDETLCKAVGNSGSIQSWNGTSWSAETSGTTNALFGVACPDETMCKAVGANGTLLKWNGTSWSADASGVTVLLNDVSCASTTSCKAVGANGTVLNWNGTSWSVDVSGTTANLNGIACPTTTFCRVAGNGGTILAWNGTSWSAETSGTSRNLMDVDCLSTTFCKIAGTNGVILSMVVQTLNNVSDGFVLDVFNANGCLTDITITEYQTNHPNATADLQNGRYWTITPEGCTSGFSATVTFPTTFTPNGSAYVCRYTGSAWSCANNGFTTTPNTITRVGVTEFSDWAAGNSAPTSATLTKFTAKWNTRKQVAQVKWETGSELNVVGFNVWKKQGKKGNEGNKGKAEWRQLNAELIAAAKVGEIQGARYTFADKKIKQGKTYQYKLQIVLANGANEWSAVKKVKLP